MRVYMERCDSYSLELLEPVVTQMLDSIVSDAGLSLCGKKVLVKPNLLTKKTPDAAVTTNPSYVTVAARYLKEHGAEVTVADSPGGVYTKSTLAAVYKATGIESAAREAGAALSYDTGSVKKEFDGHMTRFFELITPAVDADIILNLSRLKTHAMCEMSAAVKNMFGTIPGLQKAEMHARFPHRLDFAGLLVDLCLCTAPQINIVDAVIAMEGNGPAGGTPKKMGLVLGSADPFALDTVCAEIMGYRHDEVGTLYVATKRGVCPADISDIEIVNDLVDEVKTRFKRPDGYAGGFLKQLPHLFGGRLQKFLEPKPMIDRKRCIGCGKCRDCCPRHTIALDGGRARINLQDCIKCYCCQELCPVKAVEVKSRFIWKI